MDIVELKKIVALVEKSEIQELELEEDGRRIRICKTASGAVAVSPPSAVIAVPQPSASESPAQPPAPQETKAPAEQKEAPAEKGNHIVAPMIGTFYRAPAPEAPPYAQVGDTVTPETVVCIVEAMKVMNEIKAGMGGKIVDVLVENAQPVEFGQPLFRVVTG